MLISTYRNRMRAQKATQGRYTHGLIVLGLLALLCSPTLLAQDDGARSQLLMPVGITAVVPTYIGMSGNINAFTNIVVVGADIDVDIGLVTFTRAFAIGDRYAQVWVNPIWGKINGSAVAKDPDNGLTRTVNVSESGLSDAVVSFKYGLIGTPALGIPEFMQQPQTFQLSAFASAGVPVGEYNDDSLLNLGSNRWSLRLGVPMVVPFGEPQTTFWEIFPSLTLYQNNDDVAGAAEVRSQDPLFAIETHLSHNFTPNFWGSLDLRYWYGGETTTDGIKDDNQADALAAGVTLGYAINQSVSVQSTYGQVLNEGSGTIADMLRVKIVFAF